MKSSFFFIALLLSIVIVGAATNIGEENTDARGVNIIAPSTPTTQIIDTNATTACIGAQVLLGNGSCGLSGAGGGDFSFTDFQSSYNLNLTNIFDQVLNTTSNVLFPNITSTGNLTVIGNVTFLGGVVFNQDQLGASDIRFASLIDENAFFFESSTGRIGFGTNNPINLFHVLKDSPGGTLSFIIENNDTTNSASKSTLILRTDVNGGDSFVAFEATGEGTNWFVGRDNSDNTFNFDTQSNFASSVMSLTSVDVTFRRDIFITRDANITADLFVGDDLFVTDQVGIGTTNPQQTLNVVGDVNFTGGLNLSSYLSCETLETDSNGNVLCGTDATVGNPFDQDLNTTNNVQFQNVTATGNFTSVNATFTDTAIARFFQGLFSLIVNSSSILYLDFNQSTLSFNEAQLNITIDDRLIANETNRLQNITGYDCGAGEFATGFQLNGTLICSSVSASNPFDQDLNTTSNVNFGNLTILNNLSVDGNTFFVDNVNNRVGIGTASPSQLLNIFGGSVIIDGKGVALNRTNSALTISNDGNTNNPTIFVEGLATSGGSAGANIQLNRNSQASWEAFLILSTAGDTEWSIGLDNDGTNDFHIIGDTGDALTILDSNGFVGINTASPTHLLNVNGNVNISRNLTVGQHYISKGLTPSLSSCGVGPTITGTDVAGRINVGGVAATGCDVTFANAFTNTPVCIAGIDNENKVVGITSISATTFRIECDSADCTSDIFSYICIGL